MKISNIYYSTYFARTFQALPPSIQKKAMQAEELFRQNCFKETLKTANLRVVNPGYWVFNISESYQIVFEFCRDSDTVGFIDIANHSIYHQ